MANRFVRVDLSDVARDFRPIAVEPGVPLADRSSTNSRILFGWLGGMVAEPEWEGDSVNFFARDDHGGRLEDVQPQPASDEDLKGPLKDEVEILRQRIAKAKPETSTERAVHKILSEQFNTVLDNQRPVDRANYFFKYRDVAGRWRLVWCWGYLRSDPEPGQTIICTAAHCNMLYVRRKGETAKCPSCAAAFAPKPTKRRSRKKPVLLAMLLLLLVAGLVYWLLNRNRLVADPGRWTARVGSRVQFTVRTPGLFGLFRKDVSRQVVALVDDPQVVRFDHAGATAVARNPGDTRVHFQLGSKQADVTVTVAPAENPAEIAVEPGTVELGVGTTARLRLVGRYEDQSSADLTDRAEWYPKNDSVVYAMDGFLQGLAAGGSTVKVRYRAGPDAPYMEATAEVQVAELALEQLEVH